MEDLVQAGVRHTAPSGVELSLCSTSWDCLVGSIGTLPVVAGSGCLLGDVTLVGLGMGTVFPGFITQPYQCSLTATYWGGILELMEVIGLAEADMLEADIERFSLDRAVGAYAS